jgi:hypothetical protein
MSKPVTAAVFLVAGALVMALVMSLVSPPDPSPPSSIAAPPVDAAPPATELPRTGPPAPLNAAGPANFSNLPIPSPPVVPPEIVKSLDDPRLRARVAGKIEADMEVMYADILASLTDAEAAKMLAVIVEEQTARGEKAVREGPPGNAEQMRQEMAASEQRLRSAMGESLFKIYSEGRGSLRHRRMARDFAAATAASNLPLTTDQAAALVELFVQEKGSTRLTVAPAPAQSSATSGSGGAQSPDQRVIDLAGDFLSPEQIGVLRHFLSAQPRQQTRTPIP